jgi:hypothetical protein
MICVLGGLRQLLETAENRRFYRMNALQQFLRIRFVECGLILAPQIRCTGADSRLNGITSGLPVTRAQPREHALICCEPGHTSADTRLRTRAGCQTQAECECWVRAAPSNHNVIADSLLLSSYRWEPLLQLPESAQSPRHDTVNDIRLPCVRSHPS